MKLGFVKSRFNMMEQMSKCCLGISAVLCVRAFTQVFREALTAVSCNSVLLCIPSVSKVSEEGIKCAEKITREMI